MLTLSLLFYFLFLLQWSCRATVAVFFTLDHNGASRERLDSVALLVVSVTGLHVWMNVYISRVPESYR